MNNNVSPFSMGGEQTLVKTVVRYPDGEIIEEREEVYDGDVETVKRQLIEEAIMKGGDVEVE